MKKEIRNHLGEGLDFHLTEGSSPEAPWFVLGHGVTANKDREWAKLLSEALGQRGWNALRFSFSGNGDSEGDFRESCPSKEVEDLGAVLDAVGRPVTYIGHSMGAVVGVLRAQRDPRILRLVSLGGMVDTRAFDERKFGSLTPDEGFMWDIPSCPYSSTFKKDMQEIGTVLPLASQIRLPWLLVHGTEDTVVPFEESLAISKEAAGPVELIPIEGGDHVFSGAAGPLMVEKVMLWLQEQDKQGQDKSSEQS